MTDSFTYKTMMKDLFTHGLAMTTRLLLVAYKSGQAAVDDVAERIEAFIKDHLYVAAEYKEKKDKLYINEKVEAK